MSLFRELTVSLTKYGIDDKEIFSPSTKQLTPMHRQLLWPQQSPALAAGGGQRSVLNMNIISCLDSGFRPRSLLEYECLFCSPPPCFLSTAQNLRSEACVFAVSFHLTAGIKLRMPNFMLNFIFEPGRQ